MRESSTGFWKWEFILPWLPKSNLTRGGVRRLPRTISSVQVILLCGFAAILLLGNFITSGGFSWSFQFTPELETSPNSLVSQKRSIAQGKENYVQEQVLQDQHKSHKAISERAKEDRLVKDKNAKVDAESKTHLSAEDLKLEVEGNADETSESSQQQRKLESDVKAEEMWMPAWMPSGFVPKKLGPNPKNWDEQRAAWLKKYPQMKLNSDGKPRMLLVTGSSPWACSNPTGDHYFLKSIKNKVDYCRQHNIEIFYNLAHLDKEMSTYWAKLPILRKLMLTHPEIEWFFWMDIDAIFTDMLFEIPMDDYKDYNLVMWGYDSGFYDEKSWVAINNGVFFLRNCQWSLDLIDMWAPMGPEGTVRKEAGKMLTSYLTKRPEMPADDQAALGYLILSREELRPKVKLVAEYELSGYWADHVTHFEEYMTKDHPGLGDKRWPFTTHFVGCQPCSGVPNPDFDKLGCVKHMERAFNFADNQVLQMMGFMHESLDSVHVKRIKEDDDNPLENVGPRTWITAAQSYGL